MFKDIKVTTVSSVSVIISEDREHLLGLIIILLLAAACTTICMTFTRALAVAPSNRLSHAYNTISCIPPAS